MEAYRCIKRNIAPSRWIFATAVSLMLLLALQDQMRWQPWFYQYLLMLVPLAFAFTKVEKDADPSRALLGLNKLIVVAVYLWGGIHKCHSGFISVYQNNLVKPITDSLESPLLVSLVNGFGYFIPPIEILIALGLLTKPTSFIKTYPYSG